MKTALLYTTLLSAALLQASCDFGTNPAFSVNTLQLGAGAGPTFTAGEMTISDTDLPNAGEFTTITVNVVDQENLASAEPVVITFSSPCITSGDASIDPISTTNTNGTVTATYTNLSCNANDDILAVTDTSPALTATVSISTGSSATADPTPPATTTPGTDLLLGSYSGTTFTSGVALGATSIAPSGNTIATVSIIDSTTNILSTDPVVVSFSSICASATPPSASFSVASVTNANGTVNATYTDLGTTCTSDTIFATATLTGATTPTQASTAITITTTPVVTPPTPNLYIGNGIGSGFSSGQLHIESTSLAPSGSTIITANIVDGSDLLSLSSNTVDFTAYCANGTYSLSSTSETNSVGTFTTTFTDVSCDGDVDIVASATLNGSTKTATGSITVNDSTTTITQVGRNSLASFVINEIGIGGDTQNTAALSAGDTTTLSVTVVDGTGNLLPTTHSVAFTSDCFSTGLANIYDAPGGPNEVAATAGRATVTYQAQGCSGVDNISASSVLGNATGQITVTPANISSINFVSATPNQIALRGMSASGVGETATVSFKVVDGTGGSIPNHPVTFTLSNTTGGILFGSSGTNTDTGTSDTSGNVSVVVKSGASQTTFKVIVTSDTDSSIVGQSDPILVSTGIADQDSMSLSATVLNPEAYDKDGAVSLITARVADRYNNPVPDDTIIAFTTEGGSIGSSCYTVNGVCSVTWTGQNPRPTQDYLTDDKGQSTILAYVVGEESFTDTNGNGVYDLGEAFDDMPEAFLDIDGDGIRDDGTGGNPVEAYQDYNESFTHNTADGLYNGVLCNSGCGTATGIDVRDSLTLIMSGSFPVFTWTTIPLVPLNFECTVPFEYTLTDVNGNIMPAGTEVVVKIVGGTTASGSSTIVINSNPTDAIDIAKATTHKGKMKSGVDDGTAFGLTAEVTLPSGNIFSFDAPFIVNNTTGTCPL